MIIISDCNKDIVIPAGLGDNPGVVYETAGVKSLNGETGDLKIKTVNGNDMLGDGNIEIKGGVETVNGETGDVKIKTVNGQSLMGEGDVPVDVGVETLNGQKGNLKIKSVNGAEMLGEGNVAIDTGVESLNGQKGALTLKTVNGAEMLGEGNVAIDTGVESLNGQKGALTLKTVNGNELTGDGNIEIQAGSDNVIVLDGLTQEERKAIHDKLDLTKPLVKSFMYEGKISVCAWDSGGGNVKFLTFGNRYDGIQVKRYNFAPDGWLGEDNRGHTYTNSVLFSLGTHVEESGYFDAGYIGNFIEYIVRPFTRPNAAFINLEKGIGDSTQPIYAPVSFSVPEDGKNIRIQFIANEKLYTFIIDAEQENRWHFESAKPIGGVQSSEVANIKVLTQAEYDALTSKDENVLYCIKG